MLAATALTGPCLALRGLGLGLGLALGSIAPALAQPPAALTLPGKGAVRLTGILLPGVSPLFPLAPAAIDTALLAEAQQLLDSFMVEADQLALARRWIDRYGQAEAILVHPNRGSVQAALIRAGLAVVWPVRAMDHRPWLRLEARARAAGRGAWSRLAVRDALPALTAEPRVQLIQGTVERVAGYRRTIYVDFGRAWRSAAGVRLPRDLLADFSARGIDPLSLTGRRLRVRGVVEALDTGPSILIQHTDQVEQIG